MYSWFDLILENINHAFTPNYCKNFSRSTSIFVYIPDLNDPIVPCSKQWHINMSKNQCMIWTSQQKWIQTNFRKTREIFTYLAKDTELKGELLWKKYYKTIKDYAIEDPFRFWKTFETFPGLYLWWNALKYLSEILKCSATI